MSVHEILNLIEKIEEVIRLKQSEAETQLEKIENNHHCEIDKIADSVYELNPKAYEIIQLIAQMDFASYLERVISQVKEPYLQEILKGINND